MIISYLFWFYLFFDVTIFLMFSRYFGRRGWIKKYDEDDVDDGEKITFYNNLIPPTYVSPLKRKKERTHRQKFDETLLTASSSI